MFSMLDRVAGQVQWNDIIPGTAFELPSTMMEQSGFECLPVSVGTRYPSYVAPNRAADLDPKDAVLGLVLQSNSGMRLGYFPAVGQLDQELLRQLDSLDVLLFDGTFWTDNELIEIQNGGQTARAMGHIPVSSSSGSLAVLSGLRRPRKIFVHINNTNPMLNMAGPEYRQVRECGWEIAEDGCHLDL